MDNKYSKVRVSRRKDLVTDRCDRARHRGASTVSVMVVLGVLVAVPTVAQEPSIVSNDLPRFGLWGDSALECPANTTWDMRGGDSILTAPGGLGNGEAHLPLSGPSVPERLPATASGEQWKEPQPGSRQSNIWTWQLLPDEVIYSSYLAGPKESRFASVWNYDTDLGWMWDLEAGGRVGLIRYGTGDSLRVEGWQLDLEGAAFPRLDLEHEEDLISADFRVGIPLTFGLGPWRLKLAAYHLSSHLGDEFQLRFPEYSRTNYSRNALVLGGSYYLTEDLRLYSEAEWAFYTDGGSEPWAFQFGIDYSPVRWRNSLRGTPFVAINGHLREEVDFGGSFVAQAGWQWRGTSNHLLRVGVQYFNGKSDQYQFCHRSEEKIGMGLWYDF